MVTVPRITASLIVAHPDDELIFAGNLLLAHPDLEWTIHVLCGHHGGERGRNFVQAMTEIQNAGVYVEETIMSNLPDSSSVPREADWYDIALNQIKMFHDSPDIVFTHNRRGDYGHPLHCVTQYAVEAALDNVWEFACPVKSGAGPNWIGARVYDVPQMAAKANLLRAAYPDEMEAIKRDRPGLYRWAMQGDGERFTSTGTLPW